MKAPVCRHCGAPGCCTSEQERVYEEDRFYDYFSFFCPACGHVEADYESVATDDGRSIPCPFCSNPKFGCHSGNVSAPWPADVSIPKKVSRVIREGDPAKKKAA